MKSIWSGSIAFGLVNIPIKLYSATNEVRLDLDMLHEKDMSPIRFARVCRADGREIPYEEIVKGYEYRKGDYVILMEEDFKKADLRRTKTIDILDFVDEKSVDTIYFEKPYYLEPAKGAERAYTLLREALRRSEKVGVAKFVLRKREHLALLKPYKDAIILDTMRFAAELRGIEDLNIPSEEVPQRELDMALKLIEQLSTQFNPSQYKDTYQEKITEIIEEKAKGHEIKPVGEAPEATRVPDLMQVLKESLEREKKRHIIPVSHA